jgi:serine/threonine-protein kinase
MPEARVVGRYALYGEIAAGGMATVHYGRLVGPVGFSRTVAIKRLHPQYAKDPEFVSMFLDEARLAARIQHPNVVNTIDIVPVDDEVFLVMEYVHGEALSKLIRAARRRRELVPPPIAASIMTGALHGLHAAHEAKSERGEPLNLVHRDVSPQNILVGTDGSARVLDFGVAKAAMRSQSTRDGQMKGKVSYMAPEQLRGRAVDRRTDIFAAGVVFWESLTGRRLFDGQDPGEVLAKLLEERIPLPSEVEPSVPPEFDRLLGPALSRDPGARYATAREFAIAVERGVPLALNREVGEWVDEVGSETLSLRAGQVAEIESISSVSGIGPLPPSQRSSVSAVSGVAAVPQSGTLRSGGYPAVGPGEITTSPSNVTSPSQLTSMSASHDYASFQPQPRRTGIYAALIGVAAALAIAFVLVLVIFIRKTSADDASAAAVPPPPAAVPPKPEPAPEPTPAAEPEPAPVAETEPEAKPEPVPEPAAKVQPPKPTAPRWTPKPAKPAATSKPAPASTAADNCNPPTFVDKNGIRRVKPGCL